MVTKAREWKGKRATGNTEVELPSGNTCLVKRLQPEAFLESGLIPDSLSQMVKQAIRSKKGLPPQATKEMIEDPKKLRQGMQMIDQVLCYVVVEPRVQMPPRCEITLRSDESTCGEYMDTNDGRHTDPKSADYHEFTEGQREADILYADEVSMEDKTFVFNFAVGGTADVERFRGELAGNVAGVSNRKNVQGKGKRASRHK